MCDIKCLIHYSLNYDLFISLQIIAYARYIRAKEIGIQLSEAQFFY